MDERQAELQRFHRDVLYYEAHQDELLEQFAEQWVAVYNEEVVAARPDFEKLLDEVEARGVPVGCVYTHWVTKKPLVLILWL
jgi:hypothetical protein